MIPLSQTLPKISIVTPCFNHVAFIEDTIKSVLDQNYPNLEYIVIDGGSRDGCPDVIKKYASKLKYWVSEPDKGQYDAINKGFAHATGDILAWLNSDDVYLPGALSLVGELFGSFPEVEWLTSLFPLCLDARGRAVSCRAVTGYSRAGFMRGENLPHGDWHARECIQQESTFWRRSLWQRTGAGVDDKYQYAGDFELWARFFKANAELYGVPAPMAGFRHHQLQKTDVFIGEYLVEAQEALQRHGGKPFSPWETTVLSKLAKFQRSIAKRYERKLRDNAPIKTCVRTGREGVWTIVKRT